MLLIRRETSCQESHSRIDKSIAFYSHDILTAPVYFMELLMATRIDVSFPFSYKWKTLFPKQVLDYTFYIKDSRFESFFINAIIGGNKDIWLLHSPKMIFKNKHIDLVRLFLPLEI